MSERIPVNLPLTGQREGAYANKNASTIIHSTLEAYLLPLAKYFFEFLLLFANSTFSKVTAAVAVRAEHATHGHHSTRITLNSARKTI